MKTVTRFIITALLIIACRANVFSLSLNDENTSIDLDRIIITPSKVTQAYRYSTQNINIIDAEDIGSSGTSEIAEILDLVPSIDIIEYGSAGSTRAIHSRGASSSQVLTLIDGRPLNTPRDGFADFNQIPLSSIERVEVLRGPASNIYGSSAVGGVINIITKSGQKKMRSSLISKFGSFGTKTTSVTHGYKLGPFDYFVNYDYLTSHGHRDNTDYLNHIAGVKLGYDLNKDNRVTVSGGFQNAEVGASGPITFIDLDDRQETISKFIDLTYNGKVIAGQDILLKLFHTIDRLEFMETIDPMSKDTNETKVFGADLQLSQTIFEIFRATFGSSFRENRLNSSTSGKQNYNLKGLYFETETDFLKSGSFKFGARWDKYSTFGDRISPSASVNVLLFETVKMHALAAKSFRAPTFNDLYWPREDWGMFGGVEGNPQLKPEQATSFEAGIGAYLFNKFKTDITLFKTRYKNLIEWVPDDTWWWRPRNLNSALVKGVEAETEFTIKERLKVNINYTYLETRDKETGRWLIYRPAHLYKVRLTYSPFKKLELGVNALYKTKRFTNVTNTDRMKHFALCNLHSAYKINDHLEIMLDAKNIFNRMYQEEKDYPMPGRAFYGGFKLSF